MPELDDLLTQFRDSSAATPPDPAGIRRRGRQRQRRHRALLAGGLAAAVAAVAVPWAMSGGADPDKRSEIAPAAVVTTIPDSIDLTDGLPKGSKAAEGFEQNAVMPCGAAPFDPAADPKTTEVRSAVYTGEGSMERGLAVYRDVAAADAAFAMLTQSAVCKDDATADWRGAQLLLPRDEADLPDVTNQTVLVSQHLADGKPDGQGFVIWVVQIGNAVLFESAYANGLGSTAVQYDTFHLQRFDSLDLVRDLIATYAPEPAA